MTAVGNEPTFGRGSAVWPVGLAGVLPEEISDPKFYLPEGALERGARDALEAWQVVDQDPILRRLPAEPLAPAVKATVARRNWWSVAIIVSIAFHAAAALFFLEGNDQVLIEGSQEAGITMLGNASEDQISAGDAIADTDVTSVTIIQTVTAQAVETVEAQAVPLEAAQTSDVFEAEPVQPDSVAVETPVEMAMAVPVEDVVAERASDAAPAAKGEPVEALPAPPTDPAPSLLAMETIAPETDVTAVPPQAEHAPAEAANVGEAVPAQNAETVAEEVAETVLEKNPEPAKPAKAQAKPVEKPRPEKKVAAKSEPKKAEKKVAEKPAPAGKTKAKAGSGGKNGGDARKGVADGNEGGTTSASGKNGKATNAGNALLSNYPGKIVSKLRRALRYPAEARAQRLRGEVQVAFTVSSSGSVGGIRVVRSSGSPVLDKAAVETVRRAAPFPAIPDGRKSWPFTVPLAFVR